MVLIFVVATMFFGASARMLLPHLLASLVYVHNLVYGTGSTVNVVAWSLEVEVQFYLLAPLLALVFTIASVWLRRAFIIAAIAAMITVQVFDVSHDACLSLTLLNYIQFFLLGFLLADLYLTAWRQAPAHETAWDAVGVGAWIALVAWWVK